MGKEVGNDQVDECLCLPLSPSQRCPDVSWWPVPSSPHFRSPSIFQNPLAVWSPCRGPAPRELSARQRCHLPWCLFASNVTFPVCWWASRREWALPGLSEMSPGSMCLGRSQEMSRWSEQWTGSLASPPSLLSDSLKTDSEPPRTHPIASKQQTLYRPLFSQQLRDGPSRSPAY